MKSNCRIVLLIMLFLGFACRVEAYEAPGRTWDSLLEVTYKFSWYPRQDLQDLLELKAGEYGQSLAEYRGQLVGEITGGRAPAARLRPDEFLTGLPWRKYYRLSMAEFCLFLSTGREEHLQNAESALSVLARKSDQAEIEFWTYLYRSHRASLARDRDAFISSVYDIWRNVILRSELETLAVSPGGGQFGFVGNLPFLYENLAHVVIQKAILEQEIPELYPLTALILDIRKKLTVENGYKTMIDQLAERMHGANSDGRNLNFAVALLEATSKRYDFEDEKNETLLATKYNLARKYYLLAYDWADSTNGRSLILSRHMGFLIYVLRRLGDPSDPVASNPFFRNIPAMANDHLEKVIPFYEKLAAPAMEKDGGVPRGFEDRKAYLQALHQFWDSIANLAIVLSGYHKAERGSEQAADIYLAARPLELYCDLFARYSRSNSEILPDNAYFLAAYAARELGELYRERARFSTDSQTDALAFAYQMQATEIFPLDLPGILQMAFHCSQNGQLRDYFRYSGPLSARLRVSNSAANWRSGNPTDFDDMISLVPVVVPAVVDNVFTLLGHFPQEATEDDLFTKAVAMARVLQAGRVSQPQGKTDELLTAIGRGGPGSEVTLPFYELKSELFANPDSPLHEYIRKLYNEIPYENHQYVVLLRDLR